MQKASVYKKMKSANDKKSKGPEEGTAQRKMTYLLYEIEALRDDLNNKIAQSTDGLTSKEIVKLSQRLDQLIARYLIHNG